MFPVARNACTVLVNASVLNSRSFLHQETTMIPCHEESVHPNKFMQRIRDCETSHLGNFSLSGIESLRELCLTAQQDPAGEGVVWPGPATTEERIDDVDVVVSTLSVGRRRVVTLATLARFLFA